MLAGAEVIDYPGPGLPNCINSINHVKFLWTGEGRVTLGALSSDGTTIIPLCLYGYGSIVVSSPLGNLRTAIGGIGDDRYKCGTWLVFTPFAIPDPPWECSILMRLCTGGYTRKAGIVAPAWVGGDGVLPSNTLDIGRPVNQFQIGVEP